MKMTSFVIPLPYITHEYNEAVLRKNVLRTPLPPWLNLRREPMNCPHDYQMAHFLRFISVLTA